MTKVALLASQNGLGHSRRLFHLLIGLQHFGFDCTLFLGMKQFRLLTSEFDFSILGTKSRVIHPMKLDGPHIPIENFGISEKFEDLVERESIVISDNIVLNDSHHFPYYLHGHFNWLEYERIELLSKGSEESSECKFGELQTWFALKDFKLPSDIGKSITLDLPFICYGSNWHSKAQVNANLVWVSKGITNDFHEDKLDSLTKLFPNVEFVLRESWKLKKSSVLPALILGRPGMGTIRDCLEVGVPFIPFGSDFDIELESNSKNLLRVGLRNECGGVVEEVTQVLEGSGIEERYLSYWVKNSLSIGEYASLVAKVIV